MPTRQRWLDRFKLGAVPFSAACAACRPRAASDIDHDDLPHYSSSTPILRYHCGQPGAPFYPSLFPVIFTAKPIYALG